MVSRTQENVSTTAFVLGIVSWGLLLWASIIGHQLCGKGYNLYEEEYKKI